MSLDSQRLSAMLLRLEGLQGLERSTLVTQLQSGLLTTVSDLRQHVATLAADPTLTPAQRAQLQPMLDSAASCLKMLREMIFDLDPPGVRQLGFSGALERYARETAAAAGIQLSLEMNGNPVSLPGFAQEALYRAACAGIDNVAAHAHASHMWVRVERAGNEVLLKISDDGNGIRRKNVATGSALGLFASSARLRTCGGSLRIRDRPGGGTVLEMSVAADQAGRSQRPQPAADHTA